MADSDTEPQRATATPHEAIVAANVRRFREAADWSQAEVAKRVTAAGHDLGEMAVWSLEKGRRRIRVEDLFALAAVFGTTAPHLLTANARPGDDARVHEVRFEGGFTERVVADTVDWGDRWVRFLVRGEQVYRASAGRVFGVRTKREDQS